MFGLLNPTTALPPHLESNKSGGNTVFDSANFAMDATDTCLALNTNAKVDNKALQILKLSGFFSVFTGAISVAYGIKELKLARKIKDFWSEVIAWSYCGVGGMQIAGGTAFAGVGFSSLAFFLTSAKTAEVAATTLGTLGGGILGGASLWGSLIVAIHLKLSIDSKLELNNILAEEKTPEKVIQAVRKQVLHPEQGLLWKKVLPQELLRKIVEGSVSSSSELVETIKSKINQKLILSSIVSFLSLATGILALLSIISASIIAPWLVVVISMAISASWVALDGFSLSENISSGNIDNWEKGALYLLTSLTVAMSSLGVMLATSLAVWLSSALLGLILVVVQLFTIYKMNSV